MMQEDAKSDQTSQSRVVALVERTSIAHRSQTHGPSNPSGGRRLESHNMGERRNNTKPHRGVGIHAGAIMKFMQCALARKSKLANCSIE